MHRGLIQLRECILYLLGCREDYQMKKKRLIAIILLILAFVIICDILIYYPRNFSFKQSKDNMVKIEIINYDDNGISVLTKLPVDSDIIDKIEELEYCKYWNDPSLTIMGIGLMITYTDDSYEIIQSNSGIYYYDNKSHYRNGYFESDEFDKILHDYINANAKS